MTNKKYLKDVDVADRYSVSRVSVWRWVREGRLPAPISLSPGTTRWAIDELDATDAARRPSTITDNDGG